jgi:hypothetical protein
MEKPTKMLYHSELLVYISLLMLCGYFVAGCTALQPFPVAARAGDTIMLALGSPDGMTRSNTAVQYVPDSDPFIPVDLNIRSIFKLYPDQTSAAWLADTFADGVPIDTAHGPWLTVMAIDLPDSSLLQPGTGNVQVTTSATIGSFAAPINGLNIPLEILSGVGQPSPFQYEALSAVRDGDLSKLEPLPQVVVRPPLGAETPTYGAIEVKLNVPIINNDGTSASDSAFTVVLDDMARTHQKSQLQSFWARNGDEITVMLVSPKVAMRSWEARFSVVVFPDANPFLGIPGSTIDPAKPPPSLISIKYYDSNGAEVSGPVPDVAVEGV